MTARHDKATQKCQPCRDKRHTNPGEESYACECGERTCACYGLQVRAGVRRDRRSEAMTPRPEGADTVSGHEWKPLGFWRTVKFLAKRGRIVASWRHFGWELEIEKNGRWPSHISLWRMERP